MFKKKEGFTLIELLAVLVVLAIISMIGYSMITNTIKTVKYKVEIENTRTLTKVVNDTLFLNEMNNTSINIPSFYVIENDKEYTLDKNGNRAETNNFKYNGKLCDYCIIKINSDKQISIILEGQEQDVVKEFSSSNITSIPLTISREDQSFYNELTLFSDIYISTNNVNYPQRAVVEDTVVNLLSDTGVKTKAYTLSNSSGQGKVDMVSPDNIIIKIKNGNGYIEKDNSGNLNLTENINKEYSNDILNLYDELKYVANKYILNNSITEEVYFEFQNGTINKVDIYGNYDKNANVAMNKNISGSGELRISPTKQISVVIYQDNYDIKNDYGNEKLYNQDLKYPRDTVILFKNMHRLELLAEKYTGGNDGDTSTYFTGKSDWLVFYYIRRLKYADSTNYVAVTGSDSKFVTYVNNNGANLKNYFTKTNTFTVGSATVDLKHMAASIAGNMYNTPWTYNLAYDELEYDCLVSWAGDLQEFMEYNILKSGVKEKYGSYKDAVYSLMGDVSTRFGMDDVYADIDNWNLYYNFRENRNLNIEEVLDKYYSGESKRNHKNRYTSFITLMNSVGKSLGKTNFEGAVKHFTDTDKTWDTMGTLSIKPTEAEQTEIAEGFIKWIKDKAALEK